MSDLEAIVTPVPGPRSRELTALVTRYEARGVTYVGDDYPVAWAEAHGAIVIDVDGNRYLDLTAAFGVAAVGHTNPRVRDAIAAQAQRLIHGMGDVHPPAVKARLLERLAAIAPGDCSKTFFGSNGGDAIEFALKTAYLATGRPRSLAFLGAYHGLSLGALPVAGIARFREPFAPLIDPHTSWLPFPAADDSLEAALTDVERALDEDPEIGAVVLEPIQGRGGVIVPPDGFLRGVREVCDRFAAVMILDEIYTGFGRTGPMFACEREHVVPDILCIGKALAGGVPLSAAIGRPAVVDAWPASAGEALHTSTFLGNPLACAAALAVLDEFEETPLLAEVARREPWMRDTLGALQRHPIVTAVRGLGMLWAIEFPDAATANRVVRAGLQRGVILLQSGVEGTSITLAPPLTIEDDQLARAIALLDASIKENA
jgi:4-aminobutyrate aminotransferase/(S)-3-amino-2-methylpropionate transaminase